MTDSSMNFGPAWIRNLDSQSATGGGTGNSSTRYQLAEYRYGREEMLALFDKSVKPPSTLITFKTLYSEQTQVPLALLPTTEEEQRGWQVRPSITSGAPRGRGGSLERGGRISRGRGGYQAYGRAASAYDSGWGNGEQPDWSPRKDFSQRSQDNWRRVNRNNNDEDDGWRSIPSSRTSHEKWTRSTSWRGEGDSEERNGPLPERPLRPNWNENSRGGGGGPMRRSWDNEDYLPEWATENPTEGGGTFDERGAFHGSDDEQDTKTGHKRDMLQKSTSQQHITHKSNNVIAGLTSSKSAISLTKADTDPDKFKEDIRAPDDTNLKENNLPENENIKSNQAHLKNNYKKFEEKHETISDDRQKHSSEKAANSNGPPPQENTNLDKDEEDFDRLQEDFLLKLVVDEETPKTTTQSSNSFDVVGQVQPPPNLVPPSQEKWYYQDPQGTRQGPFLNVEMAEWYKAGYFSNHLNVMRECDERYFLLGELINLCGGENPFLSNIRFPILKNDVTKVSEDMLPYQILSQLAFKQQIALRNLGEPWNALTLQQQELAAQRLLLQQQQQQQQQQPQIPHDLPYMPPAAQSNPLLYMINQMQQNNKLQGSVLVDKSSNNVPTPLDPLLVQMGNLHNLPNRLQNPSVHNHLPSGVVPTNLTTSLPPDGLGGTLGLQSTSLPATGGLNSIPTMHGNITSRLSNPVDRPTSSHVIPNEPISSNQDSDSLTKFLKQFQQQRQMPFAENLLWQKQNQFNITAPTVAAAAAAVASTPNQWPQQPETTPLSMWDLPQTVSTPTEVQTLPTTTTIISSEKQQQQPQQHNNQSKQEKDLEHQRSKDDIPAKELKKRKEQEEKQAKKEADERRKQEQKKQEAEKKAADDKRRKDDEKIRKELEKAKKEAEEKRLRELDEKRRLKEQRKAEEEARKKSEEIKKQEDEKLRREAKEREERTKAEAVRTAQAQAVARAASKASPWSQSNLSQGPSLSDIQRAEKEKRAQEAALLQKQLHEQQQQQQQQQLQGEKPTTGIHLNWANKPLEQRKIKSFAEIQAEEQERLAKMAAEARLAAQMKEKEAPVQTNTGSIWNGQSLSWANASSTLQWSSSNSAGGFWDEVPSKTSNKPSTVSKSNSTSAMPTLKPQQQQQQQPATTQKQHQVKSKPKKEESTKAVNNNNNNQSKDEFTDWCYKTLSNITADVDIPTFVTFLRDIESAYDVRDYCKEYLGESSATQQFATNFLEKRRSFKPKNNAHKDDMCSPAPAITPSMQHSTEFQEVKGKNKKNKKSKMLKVDSRILGFNVTSAPDRINVGDRDYGDNS